MFDGNTLNRVIVEKEMSSGLFKMLCVNYSFRIMQFDICKTEFGIK